MAPAAFWISPITSPIWATELAAITARIMNCSNTPADMVCWISTAPRAM